MFRFILILWVLLGTPSILYAAEPSLENLYINPINKRLPEVIILYNSNNPCENCPHTIDEIITLLKKNYRHKIHAYLIDAAKHPEFATKFHAFGPLALIIIRINDGASFGYKKLDGLQSFVGSPADFSRHITEAINNFLSFD